MTVSTRLLRPTRRGLTSPLQIANLALWLDASATETLLPVADAAIGEDFDPGGFTGTDPMLWVSADNPNNTVSGGRVVALADKTGNSPGLSATAYGTGITAPLLAQNAIGGRPAMRFNGTTDGLITTPYIQNQPLVMCVVAVVRVNESSSVMQSVLAIEDYNDQATYISVAANSSSSLGVSTSYGDTARAGAPSPVIVLATYDPDTGVRNVYHNGRLVSTVTDPNTYYDNQNISLGRGGIIVEPYSGNPASCDIAEAFVYSNLFTTAQINQLTLWLGNKYGIVTDVSPASMTTQAVANPLEIAGCVGWWDASDQATIIAPSGAVDQWKDKSGLNNHATASGTARPALTANVLNGRSVMTFDGTANAMTIAANSAFNSNDLTYFVVFKQASAANKGVYTKLNATVGTLGFGLVVRSDPQVWLLQKNAGSNQVLTASIDPTAQARIYSVTSSASAAGYLDGLSSASASGQSADHSLNQAVTIGARASSEYLNGYIAEIVHFNNALSSTDRLRVEKYLAAKWGTTTVPDPTPSVGYWADKSGNGRHAVQTLAANRPAISATTQGGKKALTFDGTNGWMRTERTTYAARSVITVFRRTGSANGLYLSPFAKQSNVAAGYGGAAYQVAYGNEGGWSTSGAGVGKMHYASNGSPHKLSAAFMRGAAVPLADAQNYLTGISAAPNTTDAELLYAEAATDTDGNQAWFIGTEPFATTRKYPANILELLVYNRALTTAERQRLERYLAAKWGIALAPQVSDLDAQDWVNRVYSNGGTVSNQTASAVNQFCQAITDAGIRDRFLRLNLFCGSFQGAFVPLYRSDSPGGTPLGNATDTNLGSPAFLTADYSESNGLQAMTAAQAAGATAATKYLNCGAVFAGLTSHADSHLAADIKLHAGATYAQMPIIQVFADSVPAESYFSQHRLSLTSARTLEHISGGVGQINRTSLADGVRHFVLSSRTDISTHAAYLNGGSALAGGAITAGRLVSSTAELAPFAQWNFAPSPAYRHIMSAYSFGRGLNPAAALAYSNAMADFKVAMGRT